MERFFLPANVIMRYVFEDLVERLRGKKFKLSKTVVSFAGKRHDPDTGSTYFENFHFKSAFAFRRDGKVWILARGKSDGKKGCLRDYSKVIVLLPAVSGSYGKKKHDKDFITALENSLLENILFCSSSNGRLFCRDIGKMFFGNFFEEGITEYISVRKHRPVYDFELTNFLLERIIKVITGMKV